MTQAGKGERTRQRIVAAAARLFAAQSFDGVSVRAIGKEASVDPALINHYFGSKEGLFQVVMEEALRPEDNISEVVSGPRDALGERAIRRVESVWSSPAGPAMAALFRRALAGNREVMRDFAMRTLIGTIAEHLEGPEEERRLRASLAVSQMSGYVVGRHLLHVEPLASLTVDEAVALIGPTIQRYLTGPLDLPDPPGGSAEE